VVNINQQVLGTQQPEVARKEDPNPTTQREEQRAAETSRADSRAEADQVSYPSEGCHEATKERADPPARMFLDSFDS
jgi:hypothetical protein